MFGEGISKIGEIVDMGVDQDIIQKSGAWYSYESAKIAQGRESAKQFLADNPEVAREIELRIKEKLTANGMRVKATATDEDETDESED